MYFQQKRAYPDHQEEVPGKQARQAADAKKAASARSADTAGQPCSSKGGVTNLLESLVRGSCVCCLCTSLSVGKAGICFWRLLFLQYSSVVQYNLTLCTIHLAPCREIHLAAIRTSWHKMLLATIVQHPHTEGGFSSSFSNFLLFWTVCNLVESALPFTLLWSCHTATWMHIGT